MSEPSQWDALKQLADNRRDQSLLSLFDAEPKRASKLSFTAGKLYVDFSKQRIDSDIMTGLLDLAREKDLEGFKERLFDGAKVNTSENRPALHMALRGNGPKKSVRKDVKKMRKKMAKFADKVRRGAHQAADGRPFRNIIHIGIGGSDLGPRLVSDALKATTKSALNLRFANNVDAASIHDAMAGLDPRETLVVVVSKSFTTQETLMNAQAAEKWLTKAIGKDAGLHMAAVTANPERAEAMGLKSKTIFDFWDWVGGRYSVWSSVGLSLEIAYGTKAFESFLEGAALMDTHFRETPLEKNVPVLMGLIGVWNRNFLEYESLCIAPYARRLRKLAAFMQQLEMESNGKGVSRDGGEVPATCPVIWGDEGTNGQHAFFQWLHQGTKGAPVDFVVPLKDHEKAPEHHMAVLANCFAQSEALMCGKSEAEVRKELKGADLSKEALDALAPQKTFPGNRPSTTILMKDLSAQAVGSLIALYEHKVFVQSVIWGNNAYDQWGVELGKVLAKTILAELDGGKAKSHDASTANLIARAKKAL